MEFNFKYAHPFGQIRGRITPEGVADLVLPRAGIAETASAGNVDSPIARKLADALDRYFAGQVEHFRDVPLDLQGTAFRKSVWLAARGISWGATTTYGNLAGLVGSRCPRAVGQALGANPVPIIVPCHRILAAGGGLGGFSGGLEWKRELLRLEGLSFAE